MQYSLVVRDLEREHVPLCRKFGLGIIPWSPLAAGFLSGKYQKGQSAPAGSRMEKWKERYASFDKERNWRILEAVRAVAKEHGTTETAVSLAWLLQKPAVSSVIFGARSTTQLDENLKADGLVLTDGQMKVLDEASAFDLHYPYDLMGRIQSRW
jgi:aryl-alcohol dehydrogenase-like predicted oxidoreductase